MIAASLVGVSIVLGLVKRFVWRGDPYGIVELFRLNAEANVPSLFSGVLLLVNAALLALVYRVRTEDGWRRTVWAFLACVFVFLSFDELFEVHERFIEPLREAWHLTGIFYYSWVLVYVPIVVLLAALFLPIWLRLSMGHRSRLAASAITYITGAVGLEMVGGARYESVGSGQDMMYSLISTGEETLEMAGLIIFVAAQLRLLNEGGRLTIRLAPPD